MAALAAMGSGNGRVGSVVVAVAAAVAAAARGRALVAKVASAAVRLLPRPYMSSHSS